MGHIFDENGVKLSDSRVQGIRGLPEPTSVKGVRSFISMVNYFRDFIKGLSSHLISLTQVTKKNATQKGFEMTLEAKYAIFRVKDLLVNASQLMIMNETNSLVLYTDANRWSIDAITKWHRKTNYFYFSYLVGSSDEMGNHGARDVRFRTTTTVASNKSLLILLESYRKDGPQEPRISCEFFDSKVGPLESTTFRVPFSHP